MSAASAGASPESMIVGYPITLPVGRIRPNPWNPNSMDEEMLDRERASIRKFGFLSPIMVREAGDDYELIDGEHRWRIARELHMEELPCWSLGEISDTAAKELTLVLREVHGEHDPARVQAILRDLAKSESTDTLRKVLPYDEGVFARLNDLSTNFDWAALEAQAAAKQEPPKEPERETRRWVERIYRLPTEVAATLDEALQLAREQAGGDISDADALGIVANGFLNGGD